MTSDDNSELSDDDMKRLMNMNLDDIIDDVKSDSASIDDLFEVLLIKKQNIMKKVLILRHRRLVQMIRKS
ncbi:MAG: hypothetical protein ACLS9K_10435 [Lachnospira eligens]